MEVARTFKQMTFYMGLVRVKTIFTWTEELKRVWRSIEIIVAMHTIHSKYYPIYSARVAKEYDTLKAKLNKQLNPSTIFIHLYASRHNQTYKRLISYT